MAGPGGIATRLDRVLDTLATRLGIVSVVGTLAGLTVVVGFYVQSVVTQLEVNHQAFIGGEFRNGYVAISDIQRILLVARNAVEAGGMTPERAEEFAKATDILFVRKEYFEKIERDIGSRQSGRDSVAALDDVIAIVIFSVLLGFYTGSAENVAMKLAGVPVSILLGIGVGLVVGFVLLKAFDRFNPRATKRTMIVIGLSILLVRVQEVLEEVVPFAALLAD